MHTNIIQVFLSLASKTNKQTNQASLIHYFLIGVFPMEHTLIMHKTLAFHRIQFGICCLRCLHFSPVSNTYSYYLSDSVS